MQLIVMPRKDLSALLNKAAAQIKQTTRSNEQKKPEKTEEKPDLTKDEIVIQKNNKIALSEIPKSIYINKQTINSVSSEENELEAYLNKLTKVTKTHQTGDLSDDKSVSSEISLSNLESQLEETNRAKKSSSKKQTTDKPTSEVLKPKEEKEKVTEAINDNSKQADVTSGQSRILATLQKASEFQKKYKQPPKRTFSVSDSESDFSFISDFGNGKKSKSGYSYIKELVEAKKTSKDEEPLNVFTAKSSLSSSLFRIHTVDEILKPLEEEKSLNAISPKDSIKEDLTVDSNKSEEKEHSISKEVSSSSEHLISSILTKLNIHNVEGLEESISYNDELDKPIEESVSVHSQEETEIFKENIIMDLVLIDASKIDTLISEPQSVPSESVKDKVAEKNHLEQLTISSTSSVYEENYEENDFEELTKESLSLMKNIKFNNSYESLLSKSEDVKVQAVRRSADLMLPKTSVAVQTESHSAFKDVLNQQASYLPEYSIHHLEYQNITKFLIKDDILSGLTSFSPAQLSIDNILKSQVNLIKHFADSHRALYLSQINSLTPDYQYTTLNNTLQYINHHKKKKKKKSTKKMEKIK